MFKNYSILLVDGDIEIQDKLNLIFKNQCKQFILSNNEEEGLLKYKQFNPDIVITNLRKSNLDGIEMSRKIKELNYLQPIILLSSSVEVKELQEAINIGINAFIQNPIENIDKLVDTVQKLLKEFNFFNKYTHITQKHLKACPKKFYTDMKFIIQRSQEVIEEIDSLENLVMDNLECGIQESVFDAVIKSCPDELMILAHRVIVEQVFPERLEIESLEENGIIIGVEGTIYITQEYGKGDDFCEISNDFPFNISVDACVTNPENITVNPNAIKVDTSSWYE